ncbi:MAG: TldD/PmbA family protein [Candidatus Heimdallarchaeota archaeon]
MSDLLALAERVTAKGLAAGADELEVYIERVRLMAVSLERNDMQSGQSQIWSGIGIRALKNHGLAFTAVNQLDEAQGKEVAVRAVTMAKLAPPCPHYTLPEPKPLTPVEGLYDPRSEEFSIDDALDCTLRLLQSTKDYDPRITIDSGGFMGVIGERAIVTSKGIESSENFSGFTWFLMGMAVEGSEVGSWDYEINGAIHVADIDVEATAELFGEKVIKALGAQKTNPFKGSVLLTPYAAAGLVLPPVVFSANAENIQKGMSQFAGKQGSSVASEHLTITDNGTLRDELGSTPFDREGQPPQPLTLLDRGILKDIMFHAFSANRANTSSTGHAASSYRAPPSIASTNIKIQPGNLSQDELIAEIKRGILVSRLSGGPHPISGDFSAVVKGGMLIENGRLTHPVKELTVQGNIYDALTTISLVSQNTRKIASIGVSGGSSVETPHLALENIHISS